MLWSNFLPFFSRGVSDAPKFFRIDAIRKDARSDHFRVRGSHISSGLAYGSRSMGFSGGHCGYGIWRADVWA